MWAHRWQTQGHGAANDGSVVTAVGCAHLPLPHVMLPADAVADALGDNYGVWMCPAADGMMVGSGGPNGMQQPECLMGPAAKMVPAAEA